MLFHFQRYPYAFTLLTLLVTSVSGCGRKSGPELGLVEGVIRIDDKPAGLVMIEFQPTAERGSPSIGMTDTEGRYKLQFTNARQGAMLGMHAIRITYEDDPSPDWPAHPIQIPSRYNQQTELKAEVKPGKNRHSFDLKLTQDTIQTAGK